MGRSVVHFYHNRAIANERGKSDYQRSINVDLLSYNADGSIKATASRQGVPQLKHFNPYTLVQAETMEKESGGIEVERLVRPWPLPLPITAGLNWPRLILARVQRLSN